MNVRNVRYWHKADMAELHCKCPLSGAKRTCRFALHMSAFDPKRTSASDQTHFECASLSPVS